MICYKKTAEVETEEGVESDEGDIYIDVFSMGAAALYDRGALTPKRVNGDSNRPQLLWWNGLLIVSWDQPGGGVGESKEASVQVYKLEVVGL